MVNNLMVAGIKFPLWSWWWLCSHGVCSLSRRGVQIHGVLERCGVFSVESPVISSDNALCNREGVVVARMEGEGVFFSSVGVTIHVGVACGGLSAKCRTCGEKAG